MNQEAIHVLTSIITVSISGLVGLVVTSFNYKISLALAKLEKDVSSRLGEIRETQIQIKTNQEGHADLDDQRYADHDRRIIRLEDKA